LNLRSRGPRPGAMPSFLLPPSAFLLPHRSAASVARSDCQ